MHFSLPVGVSVAGDPLGPDEYGYIALDNNDDDVLWADAPEYNWIEICPWEDMRLFDGTALDILVGAEGDTSILIDLPFPLRYYGEEFSEITVCTNGWIAAGDQTSLVNQQNWVLPGFDGAYGMMAVFWDRLHFESRSDGLIVYDDDDSDRYIIEWLCTVEDDGEANQNKFQVVLYDPDEYETATGDSPILFQYHTVNNVQNQWEANARASTGISSPDGMEGLTYTYWGQYDDPCPELQGGLAILWTTVAYEETGDISGQVTRYIDSTSVENVLVTTSHGFLAHTGSDGNYHMWNVALGEFDLTATAGGYGEVIIEGLEFPEGELEIE